MQSISAAVADRVYDGAPLDAPYPCITFGAADTLPNDAECIAGIGETPQIDVWTSNQAKTWPCKDLTAAVRHALRNAEIDLPTSTVETSRGEPSFIGVVVKAGDTSAIVTDRTGTRFQNAKLQEHGTKSMPAKHIPAGGMVIAREDRLRAGPAKRKTPEHFAGGLVTGVRQVDLRCALEIALRVVPVRGRLRVALSCAPACVHGESLRLAPAPSSRKASRNAA